MTFLLDNNVVSYFFNVGREQELAAAAERVPLAMVEEVKDEAANHRTLGGKFKKWLPGTKVELRSIAVGGAAHLVLNKLLPASPIDKNRGERASIALAATEAGLTFVANDKNALWLALRELHEGVDRVIGLATFLRRLREIAALDPSALDDVMTQSGLPMPTWWSAWRAQQ